MQKKHLVASAALACALGAFCIAGCSAAPAKEDVNANIPEGAAPLMPVTHEGRFERLGASGCYGCHGANDQANPMLTGSVALPDDHYADGAPTLEIDPTHDSASPATCRASTGPSPRPGRRPPPSRPASQAHLP